ncbi:MAG: class I SAM-dependent methyltransferase [Candidatus Bathyarchaeota archaeon]|nr:class I SAM-dependent methyltransferase [Candidatus Bathyarchaeota archaeon]
MSDAIRAFDLVAVTYDDWYNHPQGRQVFDAELKAVDMHIPKEGIGLELGAGTGIFAEHLTGVRRTVVCLDPSGEMLKKAAERGMASVLGVGEALPLRVGVLDFTYMVTVLEFLDEPAAVLGEIRETAKEGAELTLLFINSESAWGDFYRDIGSKGDPVFRHARLYTMVEVEALMTVSGYSVTERAGTLTTQPMETEVEGAITEPSSENGVIVLRAHAS